jgi:hypothetical protein
MLITQPGAYPIFARIDALRMYAFDDSTLCLQDELDTAIISLDQELQKELGKRFGNADLRKLVPEWHKLVGSTPELHELDENVASFIRGKVEAFVEAQEKKWGM